MNKENHRGLKMRKSLTALLAIAFLSFVGAPAMAQTIKDLPKGFVKSSGVVPGMGEHWKDPKKGTKGPIYGVMNSKIVFYEFEVLSKNLVGKKGWEREYDYPKALPKPDHIDIEYLPKGHRNMTVPHFAVHMYTVSHAEHLKYKRKPRKKK